VTIEKFIPYNNQKHGKYIVELRHGFSIFDQVKAPQLATLGGKDMDNARFSIGFSYIVQPFMMVDQAQKYDYEQYLLFIGGDSSKLDEFDAEIEIGLEGKTNIINYPACIRVTPGLMYGPINITRVTRPVLWIHILINPTAPVPPVHIKTPKKK
jgi:hypothetical protein